MVLSEFKLMHTQCNQMYTCIHSATRCTHACTHTRVGVEERESSAIELSPSSGMGGEIRSEKESGNYTLCI